jgi:hypothetical protein
MRRYLAFLSFLTLVASCELPRNGTDCSTRTTPDGAEIICADGTSTKVSNGKNGADGAPGQNGDSGTIVAVIQLCSAIPAPYPEVLLRIDGQLFAVYADGAKTHLVLLTPGAYRTTDGRGCNFTVTSTLEVQ